MAKFVLVLPGVLAIIVFMGVWYGGSHAQAADQVPSQTPSQISGQVHADVQNSDAIKISPFDFVRQAAEASNEKPSQQRQIRQRGTPAIFANQKPPTGGGPKLQYKQTFAARPGEAQKLYNTLVRKYGPPKSVRGISHVWDIENPDTSHQQSGTVAVILSIEQSGAYELIMDRDRGEDGSATWALPRRTTDSRTSSQISKELPKQAPPRTLLVNPN